MDLIETSSINTEVLAAPLNLSAESLPNSTTFSRPFGTVACLMAADLIGMVVAMLAASALRDLAVTTPFDNLHVSSLTRRGAVDHLQLHHSRLVSGRNRKPGGGTAPLHARDNAGVRRVVVRNIFSA